ncbi:MAG: NAD-dependent epimerase/dehydratase family protein, partial [Lachnospiraceae bacterium]|nr:NAD-dependent epimerase/dehydratase family protein [Lachnospiraceae bacterium]
MKTYLLIGGSGFIGSYIAARLALTDRVVIADIRENEQLKNQPNIEFQYLDFIHTTDFSSCLSGVDEVIHLVSTILPSSGMTDIAKQAVDHIIPTLALLEDMLKSHTKKLIFISSGGTVYGDKKVPLSEEKSGTDPICHYGVLKLMLEKYLYLYYVQHGFDYRIVRLANPYGADSRTGRKQGAIPVFIQKILNGDQIVIWGDGNVIRDYIYIEDAVNGILKIAEYSGEERLFNLGTSVGTTLNQVLSLIKEELGVPDYPIIYQPYR